jgi:hypothetical protein
LNESKDTIVNIKHGTLLHSFHLSDVVTIARDKVPKKWWKRLFSSSKITHWVVITFSNGRGYSASFDDEYELIGVFGPFMNKFQDYKKGDHIGRS